MPQGTPYNAFIPPYPIRVDDFTNLSVSASSFPSPHTQTIVPHTANLYLLTHTHTDHLSGLSARSFGQPVICSNDAKEMLLRHEVYAERSLRDAELRAENVRTFAHLKVDPQRMEDGRMDYLGSRDLLRTINLHSPTRFTLNEEEEVTITLFDANHCPGAVMFLVEGTKGAVLHTGDLRAEDWFLDSLRRNPYLQRYIDVPRTDVSPDVGSTEPIPKLESIHLDTACLLNTYNVPDKTEAARGLASLMALYPPTTRFFLNVWTWGYEEIYKVVAKTFQTKIHVDRYKHSVYTHISGDPFLRSIITRDETSTRFHACERFERCDYVRVNGRESHTPNGHHVIYINPVNMDIKMWHKYLEETRSQVLSGKEVNILLVPLARHSPLPELRKFVSLFKPRRVVPNTLDPTLKGLDAACMHAMFADCLAPSTSTAPDQTHPVILSDLRDLDATLYTDVNTEDVAFKNLEGSGAREIAEKWADSGRMRRKLLTMKEYLNSAHRKVVEQILDGRYGRFPRHLSVTVKDPSTSSRRKVLCTDTGPPPSPRRSVFQGRAKVKETRAATTRLSFTEFKAVQSPGVDSETEDEGGDDNHTVLAMLMWGDEAGIQDDANPYRQLVVERTSSPTPGTIEHPDVTLSRSVRLPSQMPLTPRSKHGSQDLSRWLRSSSPAVGEPSTRFRHPQGDFAGDEGSAKNHTPRRVRVTILHNPPGCVTATKEKMVSMPTPKTTTRRPPITVPEHERQTCLAPPFPTLAPGLPITPRRKHHPHATPLNHARSTIHDVAQTNVTSPLLGLRKRLNGIPDDDNSVGARRSPKRRRVSYEDFISPSRPCIAREDCATWIRPPQPGRLNTQFPAASRSPGGGKDGDGVPASVSSNSAEEVEMALAPALSADVASAKTSPGKRAICSGRNHSKPHAAAERLRITERLVRANPDHATPECKAKMERRRMREERRRARQQEVEAGESASVCAQEQVREPAQPQTLVPPSTNLPVLDLKKASVRSGDRSLVRADVQRKGHQIPSRLPSQDEGMAEDAFARIEELREGFRQEFARGKRPGVVIPRLQCLESQESQEIST